MGGLRPGRVGGARLSEQQLGPALKAKGAGTGRAVCGGDLTHKHLTVSRGRGWCSLNGGSWNPQLWPLQSLPQGQGLGR